MDGMAAGHRVLRLIECGQRVSTEGLAVAFSGRNGSECRSRLDHAGRQRADQSQQDFRFDRAAGAGHTPGGEYGERKRFDFFVHHLLGVEPPAWNNMDLKKDLKDTASGGERDD